MSREAAGDEEATRADGGPTMEPAEVESETDVADSESGTDSVDPESGTDSVDSESGTDSADSEEATGRVDAESGATSAHAGNESSGTEGNGATGRDNAGSATPGANIPADVRAYDRFQKVDRATYERVNDFLRDRTYITAREWAIARLCADFRTATGVEMTKIGENLPHLVPFMTDTYSPQAVNQARSAFEEKVHMSGATFLYGAMSGFFTADELDDLMYEVTEVAKFLLEVEGVELSVEEELEAEDRISEVMREVRAASDELRHEGVCCPECGNEFDVEE